MGSRPCSHLHSLRSSLSATRRLQFVAHCRERRGGLGVSLLVRKKSAGCSLSCYQQNSSLWTLCNRSPSAVWGLIIFNFFYYCYGFYIFPLLSYWVCVYINIYKYINIKRRKKLYLPISKGGQPGHTSSAGPEETTCKPYSGESGGIRAE